MHEFGIIYSVNLKRLLSRKRKCDEHKGQRCQILPLTTSSPTTSIQNVLFAPPPSQLISVCLAIVVK